MKQIGLISVAAAALIAGSGLVHAQDSGGSPRGGAASGPGSAATPHSSSGSGPIRGGLESTPMNRSESPGMKGADSGRDAEMRSSQSGDRTGDRNQRAQDGSPAAKSATSSEPRDGSKAGREMKAEDRDGKRDNNRNAAGQDRSGSSSMTTGQAGAAGKMSSEQRSKITTVIKQRRVEPATNINFSISVGTRVPREVRFHPLPAEIVTVYPDWRGYEFFLVRNEIVVVNPRTLEIVAVLDA